MFSKHLKTRYCNQMNIMFIILCSLKPHFYLRNLKKPSMYIQEVTLIPLSKLLVICTQYLRDPRMPNPLQTYCILLIPMDQPVVGGLPQWKLPHCDTILAWLHASLIPHRTFVPQLGDCHAFRRRRVCCPLSQVLCQGQGAAKRRKTHILKTFLKNGCLHMVQDCNGPCAYLIFCNLNYMRCNCDNIFGK